MQSLKDLQNQRVTDEALKYLVEAFEDIAITKMHQIRGGVLATREILDGFFEVYSLAKAAYLKQLESSGSKKEIYRELEFIRRNGKTALIFLSANQSLLGNVIHNTFKDYAAMASKMPCDLVIVGRIGTFLVKSAFPARQFFYFELSDYELVESEVKAIVDFIINYEKIIVVYPKFDTVFSQVGQIDDISGGVANEQTIKDAKSYFFEPSPKEVIAFFEKQIIGTLFKQKVLETMLARFAGRLIAMDEANEAVKKLIAENVSQSVILLRREQNKKMLDAFSGMSLWSI